MRFSQKACLRLGHGVARRLIDHDQSVRLLEFRQFVRKGHGNRYVIDRCGQFRHDDRCTALPKSGCGTPITADSPTPGNASSAISIPRLQKQPAGLMRRLGDKMECGQQHERMGVMRETRFR